MLYQLSYRGVFARRGARGVPCVAVVINATQGEQFPAGTRMVALFGAEVKGLTRISRGGCVKSIGAEGIRCQNNEFGIRADRPGIGGIGI